MIASFPDVVSIHCACVLSHHMIPISSYNYYMLIQKQGLIRKWLPFHHTFAFPGPNQDGTVKVKPMEKSCVWDSWMTMASKGMWFWSLCTILLSMLLIITQTAGFEVPLRCSHHYSACLCVRIGCSTQAGDSSHVSPHRLHFYTPTLFMSLFFLEIPQIHWKE